MVQIKRIIHTQPFQITASLILIALLTYLFFWRLWAAAPEDRAYLPAKSDLAEVFYPPRHYFAQHLEAGDFALWNPHVFGGYPQFADPQAATFYPIALLIAQFSGSNYSMDTIAFDIGLHFFLIGAFSYLFFRHLFGRNLPALVSALLFEFGGYLTYYPPLQLSELEVVFWFPLTLLLISLSIERRSWLLMATAGVTLGMVFLAGRPQSYLTIGSVSVAWLVYTAYGRNQSPWRILQNLILLAAFALGIAAAQWLPTLELTRLSTRSILTYAHVSEGGFPFEELTGFFVPQLLGTQNLYIGLLTLILAGLALSRRQGLFWGSVFVVALFGSVGKYLILFDALYLIERLGFPGYLRNVERLAFAMTFSLAALCGYGLILIQSGDRKIMRQFLTAAGILAAIVLLLTWLWSVTNGVPTRLAPQQPAAAITFVTLILLGGGLALWLLRDRPQWAAVALGVILVLDVMSMNRGRLFVEEMASFPPGNDIERVAAAPPGTNTFYRTVFDQTSSQDFGSLTDRDNVGGMPPLMVIDYMRLLGILDEYRRNLLLNVEMVVTTGEYTDPAFELVAQEDNFNYYRFVVAKPRAWLAQHVQTAVDATEAAEVLSAPDFDYWHTAVVVGDTGLEEGPPLEEAEFAEMVARTPNSLTVETAVTHPRLLVISDTYYPGWRAEIDGAPAEIWPTDVALRGVVLPPGNHTVTLTYQPTTFYTGVGLSLLTALVLIVWAVGAFVRQRRAKRDA